MADGKRSGGGGDGGARKKGRYHSASTAAALPHGSQGVLVSCDQGKDRATCAQLTEYFNEVRRSAAAAVVSPSPRRAQVWDELCPPEPAAAPVAASGVDSLIAAEVVRRSPSLPYPA